MRGLAIALALAAVFLAGSLTGSVLGCSAEAQQGRRNWEHRCVNGRISAEIGPGGDAFEALGRDGWELVAISGGTAGGNTTSCFKRPL